jgi:hypothetical protein
MRKWSQFGAETKLCPRTQANNGSCESPLNVLAFRDLF